MREESNKTEWLHLRLSREEYDHIKKAFSKTTCRKISDYARNILMGKAMVSTYRNQSMDDFMAEMIKLRNDLNAIGNNFNQVVRKLNSVDRTPEIIRWLTVMEGYQSGLKISIEAIEKSIGKIADQWLQ